MTGGRAAFKRTNSCAGLGCQWSPVGLQRLTTGMCMVAGARDGLGMVAHRCTTPGSQLSAHSDASQGQESGPDPGSRACVGALAVSVHTQLQALGLAACVNFRSEWPGGQRA